MNITHIPVMTIMMRQMTTTIIAMMKMTYLPVYETEIYIRTLHTNSCLALILDDTCCGKVRNHEQERKMHT
jgi:hypothetical protein